MQKRPFIIAAFLFSVVGLIAGLSAIFPTDGIRIDNRLTLRFEKIAAHKEPFTEPIIASPDTILVHAKSDSTTTPIVQPILFPKTVTDSTTWIDITYFDCFFAALETANKTHVNVVHYGDSQIEGDRITTLLRKNLQAQFGGGGVGIIPAYQSVQTRNIHQIASYKPKRNLVYFTNFKRKDGLYGPMGQVAVLDSTFSLTAEPRGKRADRYSAHYFSQVTLYTQGEGHLRVQVNGQETVLHQTPQEMQVTTFDVSDSTTHLTLDLHGNTKMYGVSLTTPTGVNVDNIPMRGSSGTIFKQVNADHLHTYFNETNTRMIILQFGGNRMPHIDSQKGVETYAKALSRQVRYFKELAPQAVILFIGPSDMTTRRNGEMITYPILPAVDEALSTSICAAGAAYWSMYEAMGGESSMKQWVEEGLAYKDYIHFTPKGANKAAEMLYQSLMQEYNHYLWRKQNTIIPVDSDSNHNTIDSISDTIPTE